MPLGCGWVDRRVAGVETHYISAPKDGNLRIPDDLIKCVGFVSPYAQKLRFGGTAFVVGVQMDETHIYAHLVTAKHVAEAIEPGETVIAMNSVDGAPRYLHTGDTHWFYHPTESESVDVAVLPFGCEKFPEYDMTWIAEECFATEERIAQFGIGLGDELVIIGLFTKFFGSTHLIPIVRTGNVAMIPQDRVPVDKFGEIEAYLAEGRSIGGLSGSPVFVRHTVHMTNGADKNYLAGVGQLHFFGLMHGHWDLPASFSEAEKKEAINMGISIIVPAKKILEVLYHPELIAMREDTLRKEKEVSYPTADAAFPAKPLTKEEFEATLKKVSRKK